MVKTAALIAFIVPLAAAADIYTWVDADGVSHYTNDPNAVPRDKKVRKTDGEPISEVKRGNDEPAPGPLAVAAKKEEEPKKDEPLKPSPRENERMWRDAFSTAHLNIVQLEEQLAIDRRKLQDVNGNAINRYHCLQGPTGFPQQTGVAVHSNIPGSDHPCAALVPDYHQEKVKDRITQNESALKRAKAELEELDRQASRQSIPREWRRPAWQR